jgi:hypothetical protein
LAAFSVAFAAFVERAQAAVAATQAVRAVVAGDTFDTVERRTAVRGALSAATLAFADAWPPLRIAATISADLNATKLPRTVVPTSDACALTAQRDVEQMGQAVATMRNREACKRNSVAAEAAMLDLVDAAAALSEASWLKGGVARDQFRAMLTEAADAVFSCLTTFAIARHVFTG